MIKELIDYHKNKMRLAEAEGRTEDYKFHKAAIEMLSQPSLPSNLDEAAEQYADYNSRRWHEDGDVYYDHSKILEAFKAGAEWMAGQFQKIEGELVDWYSTSDGKDYCYGVKTDEAFEVPKGFYIRKK